MRKNLFLLSLLSGATLLTTPVIAQQADRFAYAITDLTQQSANWKFLRKLNLQTGEYSPVLLSGDDASLLAYDAVTKKQFTAEAKDVQNRKPENAAFATGVAAMAYDKKNNRREMEITQFFRVERTPLPVFNFYTWQNCQL